MKSVLLKITGLAAFAAIMTSNVQMFEAGDESGVSLAYLENAAVASCESTTGYGSTFKVVFHSSCSWTCYNDQGTNSCPM